jgi:hypothetical protein
MSVKTWFCFFQSTKLPGAGVLCGKLMRIGIRQCANENAIHQAEDRRIGANAEAQSKNGDDRESRALEQAAYAITQVGQDGSHAVKLL